MLAFDFAGLTPPAAERPLARLFSKLPDYPSSTTAFQRLSYAYKTLSKPETRRMYDLGGMQRMPDGGELSPPAGLAEAGPRRKPQLTRGWFYSGTRSAAADDENLNGLVWGVFDEVSVPPGAGFPVVTPLSYTQCLPRSPRSSSMAISR